MTESSARMSEAELTAYVAEHENEYVQQYVEALFEEQQELTRQLDATAGSGDSENGHWTMRNGLRMVLFIAAVALAYFMGSWSN